MSRQRQAWLAVLLVLLHVFGPGLHALQHAAADRAAARGEAAFGCSCAEHQRAHAAAHAGEAAEPLPPAVRGEARLQAEHEHDDCELCSELQRAHGYVPAAALPFAHAIAVAAVAAVRESSAAGALPTLLPPARAPPRLPGC